MLRGINRQRIFVDDEDCEKYLQCIRDCKKKSGFELYAYCLMGNHIHLKGYCAFSLESDGNNATKIFYSNEGAKKDILVELKKGMDIWSYDGLLTFYGVNSIINNNLLMNRKLLDTSILVIEPCNDGDALLFKIVEELLTEQQLIDKLSDILSAYNIKLERG